MLKHSVKLRRYMYYVMWQHAVCCVQCTAHNTHAALRHAATSPNVCNYVILPSVLT